VIPAFLPSTDRFSDNTPARAICPSADAAEIPDENKSGDSSVVQIVLDSELKLIAVKRRKNAACAALIHREAAFSRH
jgi:hypothetical protein